MRQGSQADWEANKSKILAGELAVVNDSEELYFAPKDGKPKRVANEDDVERLSGQIEDLEQNGTGGSGGGLEYGIYVGDTQPTNGVMYWLDTSGDSGVDFEPEEPDTPVEPEVTLTSISASYNGGDIAVGTSVNSLTGITVTGTYSDGTTKAITGYTLSGTIAEGSNTITVSYGGKTTTFTVTGVAESGGEEEPDVPLEPDAPQTDPVYVLPSATTFDKTGVVDTGYALADKDRDWTIISDISGNAGYGVASWGLGLKIGQWSRSAWAWYCGFTNGSGYTVGNDVQIRTGNANNLKSVLTHKKGEETLTCYYVSDSALASGISSQITYSSIVGSSYTVQIGGVQGDGYESLWAGTVNDFKIYNRVLTEEEIKAYLGVA